MTTTAGQHILNTALFEAFFTDDIRELGPAVLAAKQVLLANGSAEYEQISQTFLLFGDPATGLKIPLPRMPTGIKAIKQESNRVRITWNAALDSNGNAVAGYNIYRASSPAGPYSKVNTELVTDTAFIDTGVVVGAGSGAAAGSFYYAVSSEDIDGDESAQSLGISPASLSSSSGSGGGGGGGCFIDTVSQSISKQGFWFVLLLGIGMTISCWRRANRFRNGDCGLRIKKWN
jgi:hypothetical protein